MIVKDTIRQGLFWRKINTLLHGPRRIKRITLLGFGITLVLIISLTSVFLGMYLQKVGFAHFVRALKQSESKLTIIPNYIKGLMATTEHIDIDIKFKNLQKLSYKRQEALKLGHLISSRDDWVPAQIRYKGQTYRIDMRLKGDRPFHWTRDFVRGWSFKIKVKDNKTLFGMARFAIQNPMTRNYLDEWYFHKLLEYNGLIHLRYDFIDVSINGKRKPIYAIEENFEKRLIENNYHREGPIIRFNTEAYWEGEVASSWIIKAGLPPVILGTPLDPYQQNRVVRDDNLKKQFNVAKNLLELFRQDELSTSEVFDANKLATFFAITDLIGNYHATFLDNLRFYYNPITSLLEPVGYDNESIELRSEEEGLLGGGKIIGEKIEYALLSERTDSTGWYQVVFKDKGFFKKYIRALEKISKREFLDEFFSKTDKEYKQKLRILHRDYPWYYFEGKPFLYGNQKRIRDFLTFKKRLRTYFNSFSPDMRLLSIEIYNMRSLPVEILDITDGDTIVFRPEKKIIIQPNLKTEPIGYTKVELTTSKEFSWSDSMIAKLRVSYRILGASRVFYDTISPWSHLDDNFIATDFIRQPPNIQDFDFLIVEGDTKRIIFKPGEWNLLHNLIIPKGFTVIAGEGVKLNLSNTAKILTYSPIILVGSEDKPIIIHSSNSTGQGIFVNAGNQKSLLKYVHFDNLSNPSQNGWELTGAVTFYESPVEIVHCRFTRIRSEDALNIVRSVFKIDNTLFKETDFDALDVDFSKGNIAESSFVNCGNDAVDVSGSVIEMQNIFINKAGDKGVSVGENSEMRVNVIDISNSELAMASKDMSILNVNEATISNCRVGFAVYQKKPEFGPACITATGIMMDKVDNPHLVEKGSELSLDGEKIKSNNEDVKKILSEYINR